MPDENFTLNDSLQIAHNCSNDIGGKNHVLAPSAKLKEYGIITPQQHALLRKDIRTNQSIGLPSYERSIDPNALKNTDSDWTITDLSDVIYDDSFSTQQPVGLDFDMSDTLDVRAERSENLQAGYTKQEVIQVGILGAVVGLIVGYFLGRR